jgi:hypothetical protein
MREARHDQRLPGTSELQDMPEGDRAGEDISFIESTGAIMNKNDETLRSVDTQLAAARVRVVLAKRAYQENHCPETVAEYLDAKAEFDRLSSIPAPSLAEYSQ